MWHILCVSTTRKVILAVLAAPVALIALVAAAWALDTRLAGDTVARNVSVAGVPVGGSTREELRATVEQLAAEVPDTPLTINAAEIHRDTTFGQAGMSVDVDATVDEVWDVGRSDPLPTPPVRWLSSFLSERTQPVVLAVDTAVLGQTIGVLEGEERVPATEPSIQITPDSVVLVPGANGKEISINSVVQSLPLTLDRVGEPVTVDVERATLTPQHTDAEVQALIDRANAITQGEVTLVVGDERVEVDATEFRPAVVIADDGPGAPLRLTLDPNMVAGVLGENIATNRSNPTGVRFTVTDGVPTPVAGEDAVVCCAPEAPDLIVQALLTDQREVTLPTTNVTAAQGVEWANTLGVKEVIGEFTTNHPAGQPRVKNIHQIADTLRGVLIPPGATFSVNDTVGRRTVEKGYVSGPVIYDGEFKEDIGGGVSQFATTLFNAAFFGGLEIPDYMSHGKYISRYPYAREATLDFPSVDLKITNNTPYGVVIWPTYTDSSITVKLYSTPFVTGRQVSQSQTSGCGSVATVRQRNWLDGRVENDTFSAYYECEDPSKPTTTAPRSSSN